MKYEVNYTLAMLCSMLVLVLTTGTASAAPDLSCSITATVKDPKTVQLAVTVTNETGDDAVYDLTSAGQPVPGFEVYFGWVSLSKAPNPTEQMPLSDLSGTFQKLVGKDSLSPDPVDVDVSQLLAGEHTAYCVVNADTGIGRPIGTETNFENNIGSTTWTLEKAEPGAEGPDLKINWVNPVPVGEKKISFEAEVENIGTQVADEFFIDICPEYDPGKGEPSMQACKDGVFFVGCKSGGLLPAGESVVVKCNPKQDYWQYDTDGQFQALAYVDYCCAEKPEGYITETNEENNQYGPFKVVVGSADLTITSIKAVVKDKTKVQYQVSVKNIGSLKASDVYFDLWSDTSKVGACNTSDVSQSVGKLGIGEEQTIAVDLTIYKGGKYKAAARVNCGDKVEETSYDNNEATSSEYSVEGVPNEAPTNIQVQPPVTCVAGELCDCTEGKLCKWLVSADDEDIATLVYSLNNAPLGMWVSPLGVVYYVPPLGSSKGQVTVGVSAIDTFDESVSTEFSFSISPAQNFKGIVGEAGTMPKSVDKSACQMVEVPGSGFGYIRNDPEGEENGYTVQFFDYEGKPTTAIPGTGVKLVKADYNVTGGSLSCNIQALPGGGFALLELTSNTLIIYGNDGTFISKIAVSSLVEGATLDDPIQLAGQNSLALLDSKNKQVIFVDFKTGELDKTWGGNASVLSGKSTPGVLALHGDPADPGMYPYGGYLWSDGNRVRIYNRYFKSTSLSDFSKDGSLEQIVPIASLVPEDNQEPNPPWVLMSGTDGGVQYVDYKKGRLCWFDGNMEPQAKFTVRDPLLPANQKAELGCVYFAGLQLVDSFGSPVTLSIDNQHCAVLSAGGFSCHDKANEFGFVFDEFGELWENCPKLDISPGKVQFGGVEATGSKTISLSISNIGGGVLKVTGKQLEPVVGEDCFQTLGWPEKNLLYLYPGQVYSDEVTYKPQSQGKHSALLKYFSEACGSDYLLVKLYGTSGASIKVTPAPVSFVGVPIGEHDRVVTIKSVGSSDLVLNNLTLEQESTFFEIVDKPLLGEALKPGSSVQFKIRFKPTNPVLATAKLNISSNDIGSPVTSVQIDASTEAELVVQPSGFNLKSVPMGETGSATVVLKNNGQTPIEFADMKLVAPPGFTLDTSKTKSSLGYLQSTTLAVKYSPVTSGTAMGRVILHQASADLPPYELTVVAGTGTPYLQGFGGTVNFSGDLGAFSQKVGVTGQVIELAGGGFAAYGASTGAIHVATSSSKPDIWYGKGGRIQVTGPGGIFPGATGLGDSLVELRGGGFALLSATDKAIYAIGPDGARHKYVGVDGVLRIDETFPAVEELANTLIQIKSGSFLVVGTNALEIYAIKPTGESDSSIGNLGVVALGNEQLVCKGASCELAASMSPTTPGGLVIGEKDSEAFYTLSAAGNYVNESVPGVVDDFSGQLAFFQTVEVELETGGSKLEDQFLYFDKANALVTLLQDVDLERMPLGDNDDLVLKNIWPDANFGSSIVALKRGDAFAVTDTDCDCLRFATTAGEPLVLNPQFEAELPHSVDFGVVAVGKKSPPTVISISNQGTYPLTVGYLFTNVQFSLETGGYQTQILPGETVDFSVIFAPKSPGNHTGELIFTTSDPANKEPGVVMLSGSTGPKFELSPNVSILDFGNVKANVQVVKNLILKNTGADPLTIKSVKLEYADGHFDWKTEPPALDGVKSINVDPGKKKGLEPFYSPKQTGSHSAILTIEHNDGAANNQRIVVLQGRSGAQIAVSPASLTCSVSNLGVVSACGLVNITNIGTAKLNIADVQAVGEGFSVAPMSTKLAPGAVISAPVTVIASKVGTTVGTLSILHDDVTSGGVSNVPLEAKVASSISINPLMLDYGVLPVGSSVELAISVSNNSENEIEVFGATTIGAKEFSVASSMTLPSVVAPGTTKKVQVRCSPDSVGAFEGLLTLVTSSGGAQVAQIPLNCASGPVLKSMPSNLVFGAVTKGKIKVLPLVLDNSSVVPVEIGSIEVVDAEGFANSLERFSTSQLLTNVVGPGSSTELSVFYEPLSQPSDKAVLEVKAPNGSKLLSIPLSGGTGAQLKLLAATNPLDYGIRKVASTTIKPILVTNIGTEPLVILDSGITLSEASNTFTIVEPLEGSLELKPNESHIVDLSFAPQSVGKYTNSLQVKTEIETQSIEITGMAGGRLSLVPAQLSFGETTLGSEHFQPFVLSNNSAAHPVTLGAFFSGDASTFELVDMVTKQPIVLDGQVLQPGESLSNVGVRFSPENVGNFSATWKFYTEAGLEASSLELNVTGKVGSGVRTLTPTTGFLGFSGVQVGQPMTRPIHIAAIGKADTYIHGYTIEGDHSVFSISGIDTVPQNIAVGSVSELEVTCSPVEPGRWLGKIVFATDDAMNPAISVNLSCATPNLIDVSPKLLEFGAQPPSVPKVLSVAVQNVGVHGGIVFEKIAIAPPNSGFVIEKAPNEGTVIPQGESLTVSVTYTPADASNYNAQLLIHTADPVRPVIYVPLKGRSGPRLSVSPHAVNFCKYVSIAEPITITNVGTSKLKVDAFDFAEQPDAELAVKWILDEAENPIEPPFEIQPGESQAVELKLSGYGLDRVSGATLQIHSNDKSHPVHSMRVVLGKGHIFDNGFNGTSDIGAPGEASAFTDATNIGIRAAELCTGGFAFTGANPSRVYFAYPQASGGGAALQWWGTGGSIDLAKVAEDANLDGMMAGDLGEFLVTLADGTIIVGSSSAATYVFLRPDGSIATERFGTGIIRLSDFLDGPVIGGAIARVSTGYVIVERFGKRVIRITNGGALDKNFGVDGIVSMGDLELAVGGTFGEHAIKVNKAGTVAVTDGTTDAIYFLDKDGDIDGTLGEKGSGIINFTKSKSIEPPVLGLGAGLAVRDKGIVVIDRVTDRMLFVSDVGLLDTQGAIQVIGTAGLFPKSKSAGDSIVSLSPSVMASDKFAGSLMLVDSLSSDALFIEPDDNDQDTDNYKIPLVTKLPQLSLSQCPISIDKKAGKSDEIIIKNTGTELLQMVGITTQGDQSKTTCISEDGACGDVENGAAALGPGETASFTVHWDGLHKATNEELYGCHEELLTITYEVGGGYATLTCPTKLTTAAKAVLSPLNDVFGNLSSEYPPQSLGSSFTREFTITNIGCEPMELSAEPITFEPVAPENFKLSATGLPTTLGHNESYDFSVLCKPVKKGYHQVKMTVSVAGQFVPVTLTCISGALLEMSPTELEWEGVEGAAFGTVVLSNIGGEPLNLLLDDANTFIANDDQKAFSVVNPSLLKTVIPVGQSQELEVKFAPPQPGQYTGALKVGSDTISHKGSVSEVTLKGSSIAKACFEQDMPIDLGCVAVGESVSKKLAVSNCGAGELYMSIEKSNESLSGTVFTADFGEAEDAIVLDKGDTQEFDVACAPTSVGAHTGTLVLENQSTGVTNEAVPVTLNCRSGPTCELAEYVLDFGLVASTGTQQLVRATTLANSGCGLMSATVYQPKQDGAESPFEVFVTTGQGEDATDCVPESDTAGCPISIATAEKQVVKVRLKPETVEGLAAIDEPLLLESIFYIETDCLNREEPIPMGLRVTFTVSETTGADAVDGNDGTDGTSDSDSVDGETATDQSDVTDETGAVDGADALEESELPDVGCGCRTTPSTPIQLPSGPLALLLLMLVVLTRLRRQT